MRMCCPFCVCLRYSVKLDIGQNLIILLDTVAQAVSSYSVKQDDKILTYIQRQLYNGNQHWLKEQEKADLSRGNLLGQPVSAFFPQVRPFDSHKLSLVTENLTRLYQAFDRYYQKLGASAVQTLYSPAFYGTIKEN